MSGAPHKKLRYPVDWIRRRSDAGAISVVTAYDAMSARIAAASDVDAILVGDTLGMVVQGHTSTVPVTLDETIYHCRMVRRGAPQAFLIGDLPFGTFQVTADEAVRNAVRLFKDGRVDAVKLEGSDALPIEAVRRLTSAGVPVMGHIGLTPQSVKAMGGFRVQGRAETQAEDLIRRAGLLEEAGAFSMVLELIAQDVARRITESVQIPTIGIGSGPHTTGQVQVLTDMFAMDPNFQPRHARVYADLGAQIRAALDRYAAEVKSGDFPGPENSFD